MLRADVLKEGPAGWLAAVLTIVGLLAAGRMPAHAQSLAVRSDAGRLVYEADEHGNRVPDFSRCGYAGADRDIPDVPVRITIAPADDGNGNQIDDGPRIQAALDSVSKMPLDGNGFRGAILLSPGTFRVAGQLQITASGIVLRGSGAGDNGTTLLARGTDRRALIRVVGVFDRKPRSGQIRHVDGDYIPVGADKLPLDSADGLRVGDRILVTRPSTAAWIKALGADAPGVGWKPGSRDIRWDRVVTRIDGNTITIDAPITTAIEQQFGGATVEPYDWPGRIENVGIEDIRLAASNVGDNPLDEDHAWFGVTIENVENAWVRRAEFRHFAGGAVALWETTSRTTVEDCISLDPISELGGYRRHTFFTAGQQTLFLRCWSEHGRHDFAVGHCAPGPNAFVNCFAAEALGDSGPIESWASGVLYDNVRIDGAGLNLENRWIVPPGTGWSAANCVLWQCQAATMHVFRPPTANNWAIGVWAGLSGDGTIQARSDFVNPLSLYQAQLREREGDAAAKRFDPILLDPVAATNPTLAEAAAFVEQSKQSPRQLIDVIRKKFDENSKAKSEERAARSEQPTSKPPTLAPLKIHNGWLVIDGRLVTGGLLNPTWWRGTVRPGEAPALGPAITRFVPGRIGTGLTDDLPHVADKMQADGVAIYDHHYGLWYDRRRDDHTIVREQDGNVAPPFYEQPFARSGTGTAWDGLSKYDLTKFNPWYWQRLHDFVELCDERGLVLFHQNYFQHNILEAGAHWADCPWRPANNVNDMGLPEPPPYIGDKRQFMAPLFYDISDPRRRALHRGYIRQCLDNFAGQSNVIQFTSAEYSGPLEFVQFWLDTIIEWEHDHDRHVLIGLSASKNVQDAILADPQRGPHVDVIDIRYWAYTAGGELYAPDGGQNLSPRQHLRQTKLKPGGAAAIVRAVREYRTRYPDKAVTYYADENCPSGRDGWAVLIGGGSLPNVKLPEKLAQAIPEMQSADGIVTGDGQWCLTGLGRGYLIYTEHVGETLDVKLPNELALHRIHWIDPKTGDASTGEEVQAARTHHLHADTNVLWLERTSFD